VCSSDLRLNFSDIGSIFLPTLNSLFNLFQARIRPSLNGFLIVHRTGSAAALRIRSNCVLAHSAVCDMAERAPFSPDSSRSKAVRWWLTDELTTSWVRRQLKFAESPVWFIDRRVEAMPAASRIIPPYWLSTDERTVSRLRRPLQTALSPVSCRWARSGGIRPASLLTALTELTPACCCRFRSDNIVLVASVCCSGVRPCRVRFWLLACHCSKASLTTSALPASSASVDGSRPPSPEPPAFLPPLAPPDLLTPPEAIPSRPPLASGASAKPIRRAVSSRILIDRGSVLIGMKASSPRIRSPMIRQVFGGTMSAMRLDIGRPRVPP